MFERTCLAAAAALAARIAFAQAQPIAVPLEREGWNVSQKNFKLDQDLDASHNGEIVEHLGRRSVRVSRGIFWARGVDFRDGTIDVDVAGAGGRFFGVAFRVRSEDDYEVVFLRPHSSGTDQAIQYTAAFFGAPAWQLYAGPGYTAKATIPAEKWFHVRIEVRGRVARVYLDGAAEPALTVPELRSSAESGSIGFWGHMGDSYFTDLRYTPAPAAEAAPVARRFQAGTLADWELSDAFDATRHDPEAYPDLARLKWERVQAEDPGMVVVNRYRRSPNVLPPDREERIRGRRTGGQFVFARTTIRSERDELRRMRLGYSDEVVVFLNGAAIYAGNNSLSFRQPNFIGDLDSESDAVWLPLRKGDNVLVLAVTEYFGGWGFLCRLAP